MPYSDLGNPQSLNLYGYVNNNPLSKADPDGHEGCCDLLPSQAEVDATLAGIAAASSGGGGFLSAAARFVPWLAGPAIIGGAMVHPVTVGQSDAAEIAQRDANLRQNEEHQETSPEPQVSTSGAGARQGGGKAYDDTPANQARMAQGKPPIGKDGKPVELHHTDQTTGGGTQEMTQTDHRLGGNYAANHTITGQQASQIDRKQAAQQRRSHWKNKNKDQQQ